MKNSSRNTLAFLLLATSFQSGIAWSSDEWGYDHEPTPPVGLSAGPAKSMALPAVKGAERPKQKQLSQNEKTNSPIKSPGPITLAAKGGAAGKKTKDSSGRLQARALPSQLPIADKLGRAIQCWEQLYEFAGGATLTADQKVRLSENMRAKVETSEVDNRKVTGILEFWPRVESAAAASQDQKENYKTLLRALLRLESQRLAATDAKQAELISEILGPARVAAAGTPPLTEDAIEAYADMACFLYEEEHPGKTVNAMDNRMVFASVIRSKFIEAPTQKDRDVMANFDLSWSKFKILWSGANETGRRKLLAAWTHKNDATTSGTMPKDPTLESVMHKGPWAD